MSESRPWDSYLSPEQEDFGAGWRQRLERTLLIWPMRLYRLRVAREQQYLEAAVHAAHSVEEVRSALRRGGIKGDALRPWYAQARAEGYSSQVLTGALALLHGTSLQCGEESDVAPIIGLACRALALAGRPVHLMASGDSANAMETAVRAALEPFGLAPSVIADDASRSCRQRAYRAPVTIVSPRQALRDYLGDRLDGDHRRGAIARRLGPLAGSAGFASCMRGLPFAIVADADRFLIEEACEPLSLATATDPERERQWAETALHLAGELAPDMHFERSVHGDSVLNDTGHLKLDTLRAGLHGPWHNRERCRRDVQLALRALSLEAGSQYRVAGNDIELPPAMAATEGLQQLLQRREGLPVTGRAVVRGRLTFQRYFRRYTGLAAVSADTRQIRDEIWRVYGLPDFQLTAALTSSPVVSLSDTDEQRLQTLARRSQALGRYARAALTHYRARQAHRIAARRRASFLRHDDRAGTLTAFFGRSE